MAKRRKVQEQSEDDDDDLDMQRIRRRMRNTIQEGSSDDAGASDQDEDASTGSGAGDGQDEEPGSSDGEGEHSDEGDEDEDEDEDEESEPQDDDDDGDIEEQPSTRRRALPQRAAGRLDSDSEGSEDGDDSSEGSSDSSDDDIDGDGRTLEEQVADVPFEQLEVLRRDGRGLVGHAARAVAKAAAKQTFHRENKDRPAEMSSKRPVGRFREVIQVPHKNVRDPRFADGPSTDHDRDAFRKNYAFLFNDMLPSEKKALQEKIKKEKNPKFKARLQTQLTRVEAALSQEELRRKQLALETEWKAKERAAVAAGKKPYFLKEGEKKKMALLAKYQLLQEKGKLDKFMAKRARKNAAKDHRYLPSSRRSQQQE